MTDTIMAGHGLCDTGVVQGYCSAAPAFVRRLIDLGVPFDQTSDGHFRLAKEGAHSSARIFHVKDYTGTAIIRVLYQQLQSYSNVTWLNQSLQGFLTCSDSKRVVGVRVDDRQWFSSATVLATGGFSNIFSLSTNPKQNIGDAIAMAYMLGVPLGDLEFIQFHPTVFCCDGHSPLLISEALRGEGAFLVNKNNDRFMKHYHELEDLAPRDVVSRAVMQEHDPKLNIASLMPSIEHRFPTIFEALKKRGFSFNDYEIPVQPLVHYTLGGVVASPNGETTCEGLYAIGECSVTGFHGANRLASNSLLEAGIMGQRCANHLIQFGQHFQKPMSVQSITMQPLSPSTLSWLGQTACKGLGVIRSRPNILDATSLISNHQDADHPLFQLVLAILHSALHRCESRGGHYRSDYPEASDHALHSLICKNQEVLHVDQLFKPSQLRC